MSVVPNFCPNCGHQVKRLDQTACSDCGHDFEDDFESDKEYLNDDLEGDLDEDEEFEDKLSEDNEGAVDDDPKQAGRRIALNGDARVSTVPVPTDPPSKQINEAGSSPRESPWQAVVISLRWIAFIPAGLLGGLAAGILAYLFFGAGAWMTGFPFDSPLNRLATAAFSGYAFVFCAAYTAPVQNKAAPAIVMAVLMFMLYGSAIFISIVDRAWFSIAQYLVAVAAVAGSMYQQVEESRPKDS